VKRTAYEALYRWDANHWWCVGMRAIVLDMLERDVAAGRRLNILDAGCGAGALLRRLQEDHLAVGADLLPPALRYAQHRGARHVANASAAQLPFAAAQFDVVLCLDVLYHIGMDDSRLALAEVRRVLRPAGWLIVRQPAYAWLRGPQEGWLGTQRRVTAAQLRGLLEEAGFCVHRLTYVNTLLFPAEALWRVGRRAWARLGGAVKPADDFVPLNAGLNRLLAGVLGIERRILRRRDLPFGLSALALARKGNE